MNLKKNVLYKHYIRMEDLFISIAQLLNEKIFILITPVKFTTIFELQNIFSRKMLTYMFHFMNIVLEILYLAYSQYSIKKISKQFYSIIVIHY